MRINRTKLFEAIADSDGVISAVAQRLGVTPRAIYKQRDKNRTVAAAIDEAREAYDVALLDVAEDKLFEAVKTGSPWAIKFALSTKGRIRGYTEKKEIEQSGTVKQIVMNMVID